MRRRGWSVALRCAIGLVLAAVAWRPANGQNLPPAAGSQEEFFAYKRKVLAPHEEKFNRICESHAGDEAITRLRSRLALVDDVANLLISRFADTQAASLKQLLAEVSPRNRVTRDAATGSKPMNAAQLIADYQERFSAPLPVPGMDEAELATLRSYYDAAARAAGRFITERGQFIEAVDRKEAADLLALCVVLPFLHVDDQAWSSADIEAFPDWLKKPANLRALEAFALKVRRPQTAYQFVLFASNSVSPATSLAPTYPDYLAQAGERLIKAGDRYAGAYCLKAAIAEAEERGDAAAAEALYLRVADVLDREHPELAAEELRTFLNKYPKSSAWGKASMLRLKSLYEAGKFTTVVEAAARYRTDDRSASYMPQILYIAWVSSRRDNHADEAEKLQTEFLKRFPQHPLGADMYLASAMTALAAGNYEEAGRLLEIVQYRYPDSHLKEKVKQIQERLGTAEGDRREKR